MKDNKDLFGFPRNVFVLSLVSFFNDIGGETIKRAIPLFLTNALGVKPAVIGFIEGIAEATPQLFQPISGYLSDVAQKRKPLILLGQTMRTSMLFLFWAMSWPAVLLLRFLDRSGKGISNAPRDALISLSTSDTHRGKSFGLNRAFDNAGAVIGMISASVIILFFSSGSLVMTHDIFRGIVLLAAVPLALSLAIVFLFLRDIPRMHHHPRWILHNGLGHRYYVFLFFSFLFTLGNSSDAFLILKAQQSGIALWQIFLLLAGYSLVSSVSGLPFSNLSDRVGRNKLMVAGWLLYSVVYALFAATSKAPVIIGLFLLYGLYYGLTEGAAKALIADVVPKERYGTAYGVYNMVVGATLFPASLLAGFLWQTFAPAVALSTSSIMAAVAAFGFLFFL